MTSTIIAAIIIVSLAAIVYNQNKMLRKLTIDPAYGCLTRQGLELKYKSGHDVIFLDLDNMHGLNEVHGYSEVDAMIARSLSATTRKGESYAARWYSGDEIVLIVKKDCGNMVADRLMTHFSHNGLSATMSVVNGSSDMKATMKLASDLVQNSKRNNSRGIVINGK
jgi:GGDEF domain-containing protein